MIAKRISLNRFVMATVMTVAMVTAVRVPAAAAKLEFDPDGLIRVETTAPTDSITVGQRFRVVHEFSFPDSLSMIPVAEINTGKCRLLSIDRGERIDNGMGSRAVTLDLLALELDMARVPEQAFDFRTPSGDTLRVFSGEIEIPIRLVTAPDSELASLKEQWEAPARTWPWIAGAAGVLVLAALAWWLVRRRRKAALEILAPVMPADYAALTELTRIEAMGLLDQGEYKRYYTLVVDAIRHYLEKRFHVDAMDRTSDELLLDLGARGARVEALPAFLAEADLVKFAKYQPVRENGEAAMRTARALVVDTTPRMTDAASESRAVAAGGTA